MTLVNVLSLFSVLTFAFAQQHFGPPQFGPGYGPPFHHFGSQPRGSERGPLPLPQGYLAPSQPSSHRHIGSSNQDTGSFPHLRPTSSSSSGFMPPSSSSSSSPSSSSGSLSNSPYMPPPQSSSAIDSNPGFGPPSQPTSQGFGPAPSQDPSSGFNLPQTEPNQPDLGSPFVPRGLSSTGHRQPLNQPPSSLTNPTPVEEDPQAFQGEGGVPPSPSIDWGNCHQLEPKEQEKIEKAAVIKQCLELIPLPQNITQESVDQHRSDIAKCALTKENWFTSEGKYRYEKAQSEIKSKKLSHNIEAQILAQHGDCKQEAEGQHRLPEEIIPQVQLYQACMDYHISRICGIQITVPGK